MKNPFKLDIDPSELQKYYKDRLFELVDYDAVESDRRKLIGNNRYEVIDKLVNDIMYNNQLYQDNGKTIGFIYGAFYTIIIVFILKVGVLIFH